MAWQSHQLANISTIYPVLSVNHADDIPKTISVHKQMIQIPLWNVSTFSATPLKEAAYKAFGDPFLYHNYKRHWNSNSHVN